MCTWDAVASNDQLNVLGGRELRRLNTGPNALRDVRIPDGLQVQGVPINDQEVRAAAEAHNCTRGERLSFSKNRAQEFNNKYVTILGKIYSRDTRNIASTAVKGTLSGACLFFMERRTRA